MTHTAPLSPNGLYRSYRGEGRSHREAVGQVAHSYGQGQNAEVETRHWEERLQDVALEFDAKGGE